MPFLSARGDFYLEFMVHQPFLIFPSIRKNRHKIIIIIIIIIIN